MAWQKQYGGEDGTTPYWVDSNTGATSRTQPTQDAPNFQTRPTANGGLETFNPQTGLFEASYRLPGDSGVSFVPAGLASQYPGAFLVDKNAAANNKGGFFEDYALPAIIGGIATAGVGSMLGAGSLFGGSATPNALTDAVGGGAYSPGSANALTDALTSGYNSGTAIGASGAGTQLAGAIPAAEAGAMGAGIDTAALNLGAAPTNAAIDAVGAAGTGAGGGFKLPAWMDAIKPYTPLIGGALSAGGALLGAGQISSAARDAAALSSGSADRSIALQKQMYEQNQANLAPYLAAGTNALGRIDRGMAPGGEFSKSFSMADFTADPGYGFRMSEGLKALDRGAAARGGLISGAALKAGERYGQDMASQEYTNAYNRYQTNRNNQLQPLQSLAGIGQTTTNNLANAGSNYASNVGNIGTNAANTQANAGLTSAQGYASAYGAAGNALNNAFNPNPVMAYLQSLNKQGNYNG
ncbi:hypothetical protein UFOVP839_16 [uncultured Caudovirales phage]|uniref:Uncharacterized protein n=1 Tax=uncultured Caudovirales phage TaxID=2100421 RepID=A0A6J5SUV1_9CAUD|nr:hypothetical protein UFOVP839_16 [uncultured Caudovirales phage]CAB4183668.1 hypothetical protein UFOVP1100_53 [uncultured Caudovirales phage]CAB4213925.1 hypothetical protein UFOVP1461_3 [uncultured Caudovirales phage]CAB4219332.1 hypothetical protein UFOVP1612_47 [uncultured Caudovirales phage]